jgi:hypothetical protein
VGLEAAVEVAVAEREEPPAERRVEARADRRGAHVARLAAEEIPGAAATTPLPPSLTRTGAPPTDARGHRPGA